MLYQFLLDDVARKPPGSQTTRGRKSKVEQSVEGQDGTMTPREVSLFRTQSTPKRTHAFHFPLQAVKGETWEIESVPESPTLPPGVAKPSGNSEPRASQRLTM